MGFLEPGSDEIEIEIDTCLRRIALDFAISDGSWKGRSAEFALGLGELGIGVDCRDGGECLGCGCGVCDL